MNAAERQTPVAVRLGYAQTDLADINDPEATPLSVPNPAFFDRSLPGAAIQSVAVFLPFLQSGNRAPGLPAGLPEDQRHNMESVRNGLDWAALTALLQRN